LVIGNALLPNTLLRLLLQCYKYLFLFKHQTCLDAVEVVKNFLNKQINRTYQEIGGCGAKGIDPEDTRRKDLPWYMATHVRDKELLRSQVSLIGGTGCGCSGPSCPSAAGRVAVRPRCW
jgi:hypothetical protein